MTVDLAALAKLASEATPGPWRSWVDMIRAPRDDDRLVCESVYGPDRDYIAAASPDVVLALVRVALAAKAVPQSFDSFESSVPFLVAIDMLRDALVDLG